MIYIEQDQTIPENENIRVLSKTGDYNDTDPIEYYSVEEPGVAQGAYHAQFIKYGGLVYRFSDPKELGEEILKIDPESTHSAASFVRMQNELLKQFDQGSLEPESLNKVLSDEQTNMEEKIEEVDSEEEELESEPEPESTPEPEPEPIPEPEPEVIPEPEPEITPVSDSEPVSIFKRKSKRKIT